LIVEFLAVGIILTAFLAINLDDSFYSVLSLGSVLIISSLLYLLNNAYFAAIFQFATGIGTLAVLLVLGETLDREGPHREKPEIPIGTIVAAILLSIPVLFFTIPVIQIIPEPTSGVPFNLWDLRSVDVLLQGVVILVLTIGMVILLKPEKEGIS
jgi:NADH:ubiquinone oxidoreductase subunit 6 (subunit J)